MATELFMADESDRFLRVRIIIFVVGAASSPSAGHSATKLAETSRARHRFARVIASNGLVLFSRLLSPPNINFGILGRAGQWMMTSTRLRRPGYVNVIRPSSERIARRTAIRRYGFFRNRHLLIGRKTIESLPGAAHGAPVKNRGNTNVSRRSIGENRTEPAASHKTCSLLIARRTNMCVAVGWL